MSYRIEYFPQDDPAVPPKKSFRVPVLTAFCFLAFLMIFGCCWPHGRVVLRKLLIPGDPAVTAAAMENFAQEIKSGAGLASAFLRFCRQVMEGTGIAVG